MIFSRPMRLVLAVLLVTAAALRAEVSQLWGFAGEKWTPASRLPDFSFAGYRRGEEPFRIPAASISVTDFGAKGDGRSDDTAAFKSAIKAGAGKVIHVPAGRFLLSDILRIETSNLVLRGAGAGKTIFVFTKSLETILPRPVKNDGGTPTSDWSWGGGLFMIGDSLKRSDNTAGSLTRVSAAAARGANHRPCGRHTR